MADGAYPGTTPEQRIAELRALLVDGAAVSEPDRFEHLIDEIPSDRFDAAVAVLVEALNSGDGTAGVVVDALSKIAEKGRVDPIYRLWLATRHPRLTAAITEGGRIPNFSAHLKAFRMLEADKGMTPEDQRPEIVEPLIAATESSESEIRERAGRYLMSMTDPDALDEMSARWAETRRPVLREAIVRRGYTARKPPRALVLTALLNARPGIALNSGPACVEPLIEACEDEDDTIAGRARDWLSRLDDPAMIDALAERWYHYRSEHTAAAIETAGYVAGEPFEVRVFTALKCGRIDAIPEAGPDLIRSLVAASKDPDATVAERGRRLLDKFLTEPAHQDTLCGLAIDEGADAALRMAVERNFEPTAAHKRALFYFLTEQWERYEELDYDMSVLREAFEHGGESLRSRIAAQARRAGRLELVELVSGARHKRTMGEMTDREWTVALAILEDRKDWPALWRLVRTAPAVWAVGAARLLEGARWRPGRNDDADEYDRLISAAGECLDEAPIVGFLDRPFARFPAHGRRVTGLIVNSYFHRSLATAGWDGTVKIWSMPDGDLLNSLDAHRHPVNSLAGSADGSVLASGCGAERRVVVHSMPEGIRVKELGGHDRGVGALAVSGDGLYLAAGGYDGRLRLWSLPDSSLIATLGDAGAAIRSVAFSPDGKTFATGDEQGRVVLRDVPSGDERARLAASDRMVKALAFFPDGRRLASAGSDERIAVWELNTGEALNRLEGHGNVVAAVAVSGDGRVLASAGWDGSVRLWIMPTGEPWGRLEEHIGPVTCLAADPESRVLVTGGNDRLVMIWNFQSGIFRRPTTRVDLEKIEEVSLSARAPEERSWSNFLLAQMKLRFRYDIEIDVPESRLEIGEFDIELDG